jgi:PKD repeat protein
VAAALPQVVISTSPSAPNPGTVVNFNSNGTTYFPGSGVGSFAWTFGDGFTSAAANPTHAYLAVGTYNVGLSVTDSKGRTGIGNATVTVVAVTPPVPPVAAFTFSPPSPALGGGASVTVNFDASTSTSSWRGDHQLPLELRRWNDHQRRARRGGAGARRYVPGA